MIEQNNIETVWLIKNNELKKSNKIVSKINYNGTEVAVLKQEKDEYNSELLFKDKNNEYWKMGIAVVNFKNFINVSIDNTLTESNEYCDKLVKTLSSFDLKEFFEKKIEKGRYLNKCELAYISKHCPNLYDQAKQSREKIISENQRRTQEEKQKQEQEEKRKVKEVNEKFKQQLKDIKQKIYKGETIRIIDFEFYKDNEYKYYPDTQNCVLFLAKQYGIKIPLATQRFINNRLTDYNFKTQKGYFKATNNKRCSSSMFEYLDKIYECVKKEYAKQRKYER